MQQQPEQLIGGRYRVLRKIGEGGMGEVYLAEHIYIEKRVAIKLLRAEVLSNQEAVSRFRQEARSASSIGHDNIIQIDDFGTLPDGRIYMAMEFLEGLPLNDLLAREPLPTPRALDILIQVGRGLARAHAAGITHRDMKPENIFVTQKEGRDIPKILDFGIAKVTQTDSAQNLTVAGAIFGTPSYMSPEQAMGGQMDHRVDIYAMGVILYEVFTGTVPFKADSFMGILTQHITTDPAPPTQVAHMNGRICHPQMEAIILHAMRKKPAERYQSMNELVNALTEFGRMAFGGQDATIQPWMQQQRQSGYNVPIQRPVAPSRGRGWVVPVAIIATVAIAGGVGAAVFFGGRGGAGTADAQQAALVPDAAVIVMAPPDAAPLVPPPPDARVIVEAPPDAPPAAPRVVQVTLRSNPSGATVLLRGARVGTTPYTFEATEGEAVTYTLRKSGHYNENIRIDGTRAAVTVKLKETDLRAPP